MREDHDFRGVAQKITELERRKLVLDDRIGYLITKQNGRPLTQRDALTLALAFLASPWSLWESGEFHLRRIVLKLAFTERITYHSEDGS